MLVTFRFKNFGPFREEAVLDMRAVKEYTDHLGNVINDNQDNPILKVASIYGANASGKSHFVRAYSVFSDIVRNSFRQKNKDDSESSLESFFFPFLFDSESAFSGTEFEAVYIDGRYELKYGFVYTDNIVEYEWLYRTDLNSNETIVILEREGDQIELGASVKDSCEKYVGDIDSDVLVLSFMSSLKLSERVFERTVYNVSSFFCVFLAGGNWADFLLRQYWEKDFDENEKPKLLAFLNGIDVGIQDIEVEKKGKRTEVYTYHRESDGGLYPVPLSIESDGTRRAIALYSVMRLALQNGKGLIIDEFHSQLHPLLQKYLLDLFYVESKDSQLVYTTHDMYLLDAGYVRRDQVWFVEKNDQGESSLYSLADFQESDREQSFEFDYLSGIYGGIPNLKDFSFKEG